MVFWSLYTHILQIILAGRKIKIETTSPWVVVGAVVLNGLNKRMGRKAKTEKRKERDFEAK